MNRDKLYLFMACFCILGYGWIAYLFFSQSTFDSDGANLCIFKNLTGIPCPSCGSTRAFMSILDGRFVDSLLWNPIGWLYLPGLVFIPFWIFLDVVQKRDRLFQFYLKAEIFFRKRYVALPALILLAINWIWNIYKF